MPSAGFEQAVAQLLSFLEQPLTQTITQLEHALAGCESENVPRVVRDYGMNDRVLMAALLVQRLGRMNDVIHASAIVVVMPHILEPGEALHRPSLAAGNDPQGRLTSRRIVASPSSSLPAGAEPTQCVNDSYSKTCAVGA